MVTLLILTTGAYLLGTIAGRGIYWDELVQSAYGQNVLNWYASGFSDRSALELGNLILYGGTVEAILEWFGSAVPVDLYLIRHVGVAMVALAGIFGLYRLGAAVGSPWTGVLAAALLAIHPRFLGHAFFNSKDIPFATLWIWTLVLLAKDLKRPVGGRLWTVLPLSACTGLLLGIRIGGAIIFAPMLIGYARQWWTLGNHRREAFVQLAARFAVVFLGAWGIMLIGWPWAQLNPLANPIAALLVSGRFPWTYQELFRGRFVNSLDLPASYLPIWFGISTPEILLLGLGALLVTVVVSRARLRRIGEPAVLAVIAAGVVPLAYVLL